MENSIRARRISAGLTQEELGARADLTQATLSSLETGAIGLGLDRAKRLAEALGCTLDELLAPSDEKVA